MAKKSRKQDDFVPITNQMELLRKFNEDTRQEFNQDLFKRSDDDLIEAVEKVILSCQRDRYFTIRVDKFTVVKDKEEVEKILHDYEQKKIDKLIAKGAKAPDNPYDFIDINDSNVMLLIVDYYLAINDGETNPSDTLQVLIILPKLIDGYYYKINGNECYSIIQIVDGSTYNNTSSKNKHPNVVYKTLFMPTRLYRNVVETIDYNGVQVKAIMYLSKLFSKFIPIMEYILARFGLNGAINFMGLNGFIFINDCLINYPFETYVFERFGVYIQVHKEIFDQDITTQSMVMTIYDRIVDIINPERQEYFQIIANKDNRKQSSYERALNDLDNGVYASDIFRDICSDWYWLESLAVRFGSKPTVDKGLSVLDSLESIYDIDSHETLRLPEEEKLDIYYVLRWAIREFPQLRLKDNTDISTKKVRREPYQAAHYAIKLSRGIYRASDSKKKITLEDLKKYINIDPKYLLSRIVRDKLTTYRDDVNDNDAFNALKWSFKGLSGLGEQKNSTVPDSYKYVHPSQLGRLDVDTSSAGDPGMTGILCPMAQVNNGSFADGDWQEPNGWQDTFDEMVNNIRNAKDAANRAIQLVSLQKDLGVNVKYDSDAQLDLLEAAVQTSQVALQAMGEVDETAIINEVDESEFYLEDGTKLLVIYKA